MRQAGGHGGLPGADWRLAGRQRLAGLPREPHGWWTDGGQEPLACAVTDDGMTHRLWAVTDPGVQAAITADLATRTALIADGHHRYAAYRELRRGECGHAGAGAGPWDYGLAFLVDADAYPLRLGPIHRVLPRLPCLTPPASRPARSP